MRMDYITLGPTPAEEPCEQSDGSRNKIRRENNVYRRQLERTFPIPDALQGSVRFGVKTFPHDFGSYSEVVIMFDTDNETAVEFAYDVDARLGELCGTWDAISQAHLLPKFGETLERDLQRIDDRYTPEQLK